MSRVFPCLPAALVLAACLAAQQAQKPANPALTFHASVGEVLVQVSVTDKQGHTVTDLPQSDFTVYDNNAAQKIDSFSQGDAPVSLGILVDNSGSMRGDRLQVDQAALNFVRAGNPQDQTFIVKFNDYYHLVAPFTNNIAELEKGLGSVNPASATALFDAIIRGVEYLNQNGTRAKKAILLISDGADDASGHDLKQTEDILRAQDAPMIYCIGLSGDDQSGWARHENAKVLQAIAALTGGEAYFPTNIEQVNAITQGVARQIRQQYTLTYQSNQPAPGYHALRVEIRDAQHKHLRIYTRRGYTRP